MVNDLTQQFVENLIIGAGLSNMPESFKKEYYEKLGIEAQRRIGAVALKELTPKAMDEFTKLVETNPEPEKIEEFFRNNITDYETKIGEALRVFAAEFIESAQKLRASLNK